MTKFDKVYTGSIGVEFEQIENVEGKNWLYNKLESEVTFSSEDKKTILNDLVEVEGFEQYLHTKFPGAKRFSVEGGDASIVAMSKVYRFIHASGRLRNRYRYGTSREIKHPN